MDYTVLCVAGITTGLTSEMPDMQWSDRQMTVRVLSDSIRIARKNSPIRRFQSVYGVYGDKGRNQQCRRHSTQELVLFVIPRLVDLLHVWYHKFSFPIPRVWPSKKNL
jgi:hypothetical protein